MDTLGPRPDTCRDAAEFVQLMRQLKDRSGYTFRQLEEKAAASGDVLARSTIADILRRQSLPRPEVLAAFVRACAGPEHVGPWLAARDRLADVVAESAPGSTGQPEPMPPAASPGPRSRHLRRAAVPLLVATAALLAVAALIVLPDRRQPPVSRAEPVGGASAATSGQRRLALDAEESVALIRPARTPQLCLTEGREHTRRYESPVAVQRPCGDSGSPETVIERAGDGLYRIKWVHPQQGVGCLTIVRGGPAADMLEPWNDCHHDQVVQEFRIEPVDVPVAGGFRLRPASGEWCIGIRANELAAQAEAVQETCTGDGDQEFLIDLVS
ncbi:XRE family transcriptional regulator [Micromonospora sp. R77]|uniref:XRE family transcriptional regulator n=1 Tax=Micromonospora sp. R77 TaxID=2925836 RepID=UPI001F609067|nr:XRE family transcriptional regulator [Micromonospora sp. R77]MCI4062872.1 XRE family transcriptional regulator [Micromonospora sp. R77]